MFEYYEKGKDLYKQGYYQEAIKKFEKAKLLDEDKSYSHNFNYYIGLSYSRVAENAEDVAEKKQFYEMVIKHLLAVKQDYDYEKDNDFQDLNETLGIALYKIGRKKEALEYLENYNGTQKLDY